MALVRRVVVVGLVLLLAVDLAAANALIVADRTVMNDEFVRTTLEEEEAYAELQSVVSDRAAEQLEASGPTERLPVSIDDLIADAVTRRYIESQVERNLNRTYAYFEGEREAFSLAVNLSPVKRNVGDVVESEIRNLSVSEIISLATGNETPTVNVSGVTFDTAIVGRMARNRSAYRDARQQLRADIRTVVLDRLVDEAYRTRSNDELLALVIDGYDPTAYNESEKERLVRDRETEIKNELRGRLEAQAGDRINETVDSRLATINDRISERVEQRIETSVDMGNGNVSLAEPTAELVLVGVDGLTTDMGYETFRSRLDDAKADLARNASLLVRAQLDEQVPNRIDLTDTVPEQTRQQLRTTRRAFGITDILSIGLPAVGLVLIGLLWFVSRSVWRTAAGAGVGFAAAGGVSYLIVIRVQSQLRRAVETGGELPATEVLRGLIDQILAVATGQSLAVTLIGVLGIAVGGVLWLRRE